jgi:hypothetical protein
VGGSAQQAQPAWNPPLDADAKVLTSTFGEHRTGHFHSGIDLGTGGEAGLPVRAVASGRIVRMRASAHGYGRALYLETDSGWVAVYAHLDRFVPRLERLLRERQEREGEYEADFAPEPAPHVGPDSLLGWSGDTGAGPPHFHFELRRGGTPQNPLLQGIDVPDGDPPAVGWIQLVSLSAEASVGGEPTFLIETDSKNELSPIELWGEIGVVSQIIDRAGPLSGRLAPLEASLLVEPPQGSAQRISHRTFAGSSFERTREVDRVYSPDPSGDLPGIRLFVWPGDGGDPTWNPSGPGTGRLDVSSWGPGVHHVVVEASDAAGNVGRRTFPAVARQPSGWITLVRGPSLDQVIGEWMGPTPPSHPLCALVPGSEDAEPLEAVGWGTEGRWWDLSIRDHSKIRALRRLIATAPAGTIAWDLGTLGTGSGELSWEAVTGGLLLRLRPPDLPASTPRLRLRDGRETRRRHFRPSARGDWWIVLTPRDLARCLDPPEGILEGPPLEAAWGPPGSPGKAVDLGAIALLTERDGHWDLPGSEFRLAWDAGASYGTTLLHYEERGRPSEVLWSVREDLPVAWLDVAGPVVSIAPDMLPLARAISFQWRGAHAGQGWGLYRKTPDGWTHHAAFREGDGPRSAPLDRLGDFAVLRDDEPPWIADPVPADGSVVGSPPGALIVRVGDAGSGFRPEDADLWLDGRMVLARYDPDRDLLLWEPDEPLAEGLHAWRARVVDRVGLATQRGFSFLVKRP